MSFMWQICTIRLCKRLVNTPCLFLQNEMGLHKELDPQPQSTGRHIVHLLADAVPQIEPQVLSLAACELQPKVVYLNYAQLSANLGRDDRNESQKWILRMQKKDPKILGVNFTVSKSVSFHSRIGQ